MRGTLCHRLFYQLPVATAESLRYYCVGCHNQTWLVSQSPLVRHHATRSLTSETRRLTAPAGYVSSMLKHSRVRSMLGGVWPVVGCAEAAVHAEPLRTGIFWTCSANWTAGYQSAAATDQQRHLRSEIHCAFIDNVKLLFGVAT
jgi:hypothetical protein